MLPGAKVWVPNPYPEAGDEAYRAGWLPAAIASRPPWVPATVTGAAAGGSIAVTTALAPSMKVTVPPEQVVPFREVSKLDDLVQLPEVTEASLLFCVQTRYLQHKYFTSAGDLLLSVNPWQVPTDEAGVSLFDAIYVRKYHDARQNLSSLPPHLFQASASAFHSLVSDGESHTLVMCGQSGAGKTECAKALLQYFATVSSTVDLASQLDLAAAKTRSTGRRGSLGSISNPFLAAHFGSVERVLCEAWTVLEAFGHAATARNPNSSRFSLLARLRFNSEGSMVGVNLHHCLLETSRVCGGMSNFHVFYQLLAGATSTEASALHLRAPAAYNCVGPSFNPEMVPEYRDGLLRLRAAMKEVGIGPRHQIALWKILSAIMLLSNIQFGADDQPTPPRDYQLIADLLGIERATLTTVANSAAACATFAQLLYSATFEWLVNCVTHCLSVACAAKHAAAIAAKGGDASKLPYIGIMDVNGFEDLEANSLEQLCNNFAHERLQGLFYTCTFKLEQQAYEREHIDHIDVVFPDNQPVLDLLEKRPMGILAQLEEACGFPRSTDTTFLAKLNSTCRKHPAYDRSERKATAATSFVVRHAAGPVSYDTNNFLAKNRCMFTPPMIEVAAACFRAVLPNDASTVPPPTLRPEAHAQVHGRAHTFQSQLDALFETAGTTHLKFVRCLRPNDAQRSDYVDASVLRAELSWSATSDFVSLRKTGFPCRVPNLEFYGRFLLLAPQRGQLTYPPPPGVDLRTLCQQLVSALDRHPDLPASAQLDTSVLFGSERLFMRRSALEGLEALRTRHFAKMDAVAVRFQAKYRGFRVRKAFNRMWEGFLRLQAAHRARAYRTMWQRRIGCAVTVQRVLRGWVNAAKYHRTRRAVLKIQRWFRGCIALQRGRHLRHCVRVTHALARGYAIRRQVLRMTTAILVIQRLARDFLIRRRAYWARVRAVLFMQSLWRGYSFRIHNEDVLQFLATRRHVRAQHHAAALFQSGWRALLVRRRFRQLRAITLTLQHWARARIARSLFLSQRQAAVTVQAGLRGMAARKHVRKLHTMRMVVEELWRLKQVREREILQLAHYDETVSSSALTTAAAKRTAHVASWIVDVDMIVDCSDVYPSGWSGTFAKLSSEIAARGSHIVEVGLGAAHSVALADDGKVYTWGWGDRGQLGLGAMQSGTAAMLVEGLLFPEVDGITRSVVTPMAVLRLACGEDHTLALSDDGRVFAWGSARRGQLGLGDFQTSLVPRHVTALRRRVSDIAAGAVHSMALVAAGSLYCWGAGATLGNGVFTGTGDAPTPTAVRTLTKHRVRHIAAGWAFCVVTTHSGDVFTWGANEHGQLATGDTRSRLIPTQVKSLESNNRHCRITSVAAGARHCIALSATCRLFAWGWNAFGQLGLGDTEDRTVATPVLHPKVRRVAAVHAGWRQTLVLLESDEVFAWGCTAAVRASVAAGQPSLSPEAALAKNAGGDGPVTLSDALFHTAVPAEVPFHDTPRRVPKRLWGAISPHLAVCGLVYHQQPVDRITMREAELRGVTRTVGTSSLIDDDDDDFAQSAIVPPMSPIKPVVGSPLIASARKLGGSPGAKNAPPAVTGASILRMTPEQLQRLSADELRKLVSELATPPPAPAGAAAGREQPDAGQPKWQRISTGQRGSAAAATNDSLKKAHLAAESRARTELLRFQTVLTEEVDSEQMPAPVAQGAANAGTPSSEPTGGSPSFAQTLLGRELPSDRKERKARMAEESRARTQAARAAARLQREGRPISVLSFFGSHHLVATSNDDMTASDVLQQYEIATSPRNGPRAASAVPKPVPGGAPPPPPPPPPATKGGASGAGTVLTPSQKGVTVRALIDASPGSELPIMAAATRTLSTPPPVPAAATPTITPDGRVDYSVLRGVIDRIKQQTSADLATLWDSMDRPGAAPAPFTSVPAFSVTRSTSSTSGPTGSPSSLFASRLNSPAAGGAPAAGSTTTPSAAAAAAAAATPRSPASVPSVSQLLRASR